MADHSLDIDNVTSEVGKSIFGLTSSCKEAYVIEILRDGKPVQGVVGYPTMSNVQMWVIAHNAEVKNVERRP